MADKKDPLDVSQLAKKDLSEIAFPAAKLDFRVFFDRAIHERIAAHAGEKLSLEICGFLVGQWYRDANGPYLHINEAVRCDKAVSNAGDVTFTHEAWNEVNREMDTKYPDRSIVGWYHSHPNFGIFLSDRDQFCQDYTFNSPGQVAYVVDPVNGVEGVFHWRGGKSVLCPHFWVGDKIHFSSQGAGRTLSSASPAGKQPDAIPRPEPMQPMSSMTWILGAICLLLLGYLLGTRISAWDHAMLAEGVMRHFGQFKVLKLGLRENLGKVNDNLQVIRQEVGKLATEHIALAGDAAEEKKKEWVRINDGLVATSNAVNEIKFIYGLDPDESAIVQRIIDEREAEAEGLRVQAAKDSAARNSAQKSTPAKSSAEGPAKSSGAPLPVIMPGDKPALPMIMPDIKPADSPKPATSAKKPQ
jgi:proteasome lid subunit RPN8/RPN11